MSSRRAKRITLGLFALTVVLLILSAILGFEVGNDSDLILVSFTWAMALTFSGVGSAIATREPGNAIGWIFCVAGIGAALATLTPAYADYWLAGAGGSAALGEPAAAYSTISWIPFVLLPVTFLLLLFPDGRLPEGQRWRRVAQCAAVGIAGTFVTSSLTPGPLEDYPQLDNPYGIDSPVMDPLLGLSFLLIFAGIVGSVAAMITRFRHASGEQRQQIKWITYAGAVAAAMFPVTLTSTDGPLGEAVYAPIMASILGLPIAAGIAILRHNLYDIDVVINRTLVYGALTATLAGLYLGTVLLFQLALSGVTSESDLAIAASTLAVVAAFRPLRSRIQEGVDRRFYRSRYDARQILEGFSGRLRDQVELAALDAELRGVVAETMQPTHVSLWLRGDPSTDA